MSVQVEINEADDILVLSFTGDIAVASLPAVEPSDAGIAVYLTKEDARELHELLGRELICTDCSCFDSGIEYGRS